ncbi:MAG: PAS domain S-box protein [Candidatus Bathyarchaeota archaeon]|nr:PAS domain S-box protein [Candidatus Bathyarchaeota archaeon]
MAESDVEVSTGVVVDLTEKTPIRVLHVDDEAVFLKVAKQCLEMQGPFQVETASSVEEAMEKMKKKTFDVIVSDYVMPGKDGLEFLKELRDSGNDVPFIIFTGKGREEVAIKALNLGADRYLNKGGDPETVYGELAHSIYQTVSRKRAEEMLRESEEKYKNLFENAKDVTLTLDLKGKITSINKAAVEYGFKREDIIGKIQLKFVPKKYWPKLLKELVQIARGKTVEGKIEIITPKGKKAVEYRSNPMVIDNKVVGVQTILRDITERRKAEEALIRLSSAVKMTSDSVVISDLDGKIIDVNEATLKMYGTDDKKDLIGKSSYDLIAPEDREKALASAKETLGKGYVKGREYNIITKDGGRVPVEMSVAIMKDMDGKPIGFVGISRDITERKQAEEKIKNLAKFPSENPNPVLRIAKDGTILYANNAGQSLLSGWKRGIGQPALDYLRRSIANSVSSGLEEEIEIKYRDRIFSFVLTPIADADYVNVYGRDITERKKMDEELKSSRERLSILFEYAPDAYYLNDLKGNFIDGNKAAEELTGYSRSELIGKSFLKLKLLPRSELPKAAKLLIKNALGKPTGPDELTLNRKDGTQVSVEIRTFPVKIRDQTLVLGIARDITERKKAEKTLRGTMEELKMTNEKMRVVGRLTRHDVRNKLSAVTGNIFLTKQKVSGDREALTCLDDAESAVRQVERIFDFARTYEKLGVEELAYMNVEKSVREAVSLFADLHGVKLVNDCRGLTVLADSLLRQLFYNLIDNSLKYGEKVSKIRISYKEVRKDQLKLVYEDDGVGIPKAEKEKIFREGYGKGTGYGLYLIRKMCEVYGWTIKETGKQGKGARFTIIIPEMGEDGKILYKLQ